MQKMPDRKRFFLSYKFTDVPLEQLHAEIDPIRDSITESGHDFFCNLYDEENYQKYGLTPKQIMQHALSELEKSTHCLVYIKDVFGGGSAMEVGYAIARGIPIIALVSVFNEEKLTSLRALADTVIQFDDLQTLKAHLQAYNTQP